MGETRRRSRLRAIAPLLLQPIGVVVAGVVLLLWLSGSDLSATELSTLEPSVLTRYVGEHLLLTLVSAIIVLLISIPVGILLSRRAFRRAQPTVLAIANFGQAAPAIGLIVLLAMWLGFGFWAAIVALVAYAMLPVISNTVVGLAGVDPRLVEGGRGMGMSAAAVLFRVELPLAVPVMLSGIRTALVLLVGSATLATFVDGGGLGILITTGVSLALNTVLITGSVIVALLALSIDWLGRVVEYVATPKGLS